MSLSPNFPIPKESSERDEVTCSDKHFLKGHREAIKFYISEINKIISYYEEEENQNDII